MKRSFLKEVQKELALYKRITEFFRKKFNEKDFSPFLVFNLLVNQGDIYNAKEIRNLWLKGPGRESLKRLGTSFYLHIPFCLNRCEYCLYFLRKLNNEKELDFYIDSLIDKFIFFQKTFSDLKFKTLYVGGGTPSLLSEKHLENLFKALYHNFDFEPGGQKTFECNPLTTSFRKLKILEKWGINRISFGIQTLNSKILNSMNRGYQTFDLIKKVLGAAKKCKNFKRINTDLIIGLYGESPSSLARSFSRLAALEPDSIAIYYLQPTREYLTKYYNGKENVFKKELKTKIQSFFEIIEPLTKKFGYWHFRDIASQSDCWNFISEKYIMSGHYFEYSYESIKPLNCFSLGNGSESYIFGVARYSEPQDFVLGKNFNPIQKRHKVIKFRNLREQKLYYILTALTNNRLSILAYNNFFSSDLFKDFWEPFIKLKILDKIKIIGDSVLLTTKTPLEKFIYSLFFLDKEYFLKNDD